MDTLPPEHPHLVLQAMIDQDREALGCWRACFDWAVQQTCAAWVMKHEGRKLRDVHPNVLAGDFRQSAIFRYHDAYPKKNMRVVGGPNCSVVTFSNGDRTPVRKHPRYLYTGYLITPTEYPSDTLFGPDFGVMPWRPYIIWETDLDKQVLLDIWLAAVAHMKNVRKTTIFDRIALPPAIQPPLRSDQPTTDNPEDGKWPEWPAKGSGDEPA